jgi:hypothetical protein
MKTLITSISVLLLTIPATLTFGQNICAQPTAQADLDINNVRTTILVGGDMWWDLTTAKYEVPKGSGKHSLYAGALWIGGIDAGGQIKVAAQTYHQTGNDFYGGPLNTTTVNITPDKCREYDRFWKVTKAEVQQFNEDGTLTNDIKNWPGNGDASSDEGQFLAPFFDADADGIYDYTKGDYPGYNFLPDYPQVAGVKKSICNEYLFGDQTIWWVFNDKGNIHGETGSDPIGLEIRAQAFSFQSNDEINNMTFYKYQIINRSTLTLNDTYFGQWVDPDLGYAEDDYVGCDVKRGLGFCYNGDAVDETAIGYGINPPAIGVDFFQGPSADPGDLVDNDRDGCIDCTFLPDSLGTIISVPDLTLPEQIIMSKFVYYHNINNVPDGNPNGFTDFYNYLRGIWLDNQPMTFGENGRNINSSPTDYMFPGNTDPDFPNEDWTENSVGNPTGDRRFLQSAGTFTLQPGAVNYITTGVVWGRATQGGQLASIAVIKLADDKAQALFDNCFKLLDGPDAPDVAIRELDKEIIITLLNTDTTTVELYHEKDPTIPGENDSLKFYDFQGYQIYQLKNSNVTVADIGNPDKIRLVAQCDIKDGVAQLVNFKYEPTLNANIPIEMVNGSDKGIMHSFQITRDLFATGTSDLINHKSYYYTVVSYAHNNYKKYNPDDPELLDGQKKPYLAGRNNVKTYSAIPHISSPELNGMALHSEFGQGPYITRIEGQGNGGMVLNLTKESVAELLLPPFRSAHAVYEPLQAPVLVKVYDPVLVKSGIYEIKMASTDPDAFYSTRSLSDEKLITSDYPVSTFNEQLYPEWGISSMINTTTEPGDTNDVTNGFLTASVNYSNPSAIWLSSVKDIDGAFATGQDWIRSGTTISDYTGIDDNEVYEKVLSGSWAPYKLVSKDPVGPKWSSVGEALITLSPTADTKTGISSIDVIFTADKSKWTRAAVVETGSNFSLNMGNARQFELRNSNSIGKNGEQDYSVSSHGMSWFPGYAYNVETGERLNIAFGENSSLTADNSQDMKFNPSTRTYTASGQPVLGGMHFIYIFGHNGDGLNDVPLYDSCRFIATKLTSGNSSDKRAVWKNAMWCNIPLAMPGYETLDIPSQIPSDIHVKIRVSKIFRTYATVPYLKNSDLLSPGTLYYVASTPVTHNGITYNSTGESFTAVTPVFTGDGTVTVTEPENNFAPLYRFGTSELAVEKDNNSIAKDALKLVNVVPNPYYAYSGYEASQLDTKIKIVNLPPSCTVTILTQNGTIVKKIRRAVSSDNTDGTVFSSKSVNGETSVEWDLKNTSGIPIASGIYLINIDAGALGQRTLKWFAMLRPIDLDTF